MIESASISAIVLKIEMFSSILVIVSTFFGIFLTLFFVIDALGNIPGFLHLLKPYEKKKRMKIVIRELIFALIIMIIFNYLGEILLPLLNISHTTVQVAGGIVLFLIAIRLIFRSEEEVSSWKEQEPFIVPIATPIIAGPSTLAVIMIFSQNEFTRPILIGAILLAWFFSSILFFFAEPIHRFVKAKGLNAAQRLMGLIVAMIAVQLFLEGIAEIL